MACEGDGYPNNWVFSLGYVSHVIILADKINIKRRKNMPGHFKRIIVVLGIFLLLSACDFGGGDDTTTDTTTTDTTTTDTTTTDTTTTTLISGVASKGPIDSGTVTIYAVAADGTKGASLGSTTTSADGSYSVDIGTYTGAILAVVTGGNYVDEATGVNTTNNTLSAALAGVTQDVTVAITPFTEIAVRNAGTLTALKITAANSLVSATIGDIDIISNLPADVISTTSETASAASQNYGLILAAISQMISDGSFTDLASCLSNIEADLTDNTLDSTGAAISTSLTNFLDSENNATGLTSTDVAIDDSIVLATTAGVFPLVGSWGTGYSILEDSLMELTFNKNGTYVFYQKDIVPDSPDPDSCGAVGVEYGTYFFDAVTGKLTATPEVDNTGCWGLSHTVDGWLNVIINDENTVTISEGGDSNELHRVIDLANPIIGSWKPAVIDSEDETVTFYPNGSYFQFHRGDDTNCSNGEEYGTYTYDPQTEFLNTNQLVDNNLSCGLSDLTADATIHVSGDTLTVYEEGELASTLTRVEAMTPVVVPSRFSMEYLSGKKLYDVWFGQGEDENGVEIFDVPCVMELVFNQDGTITYTGLSNDSSIGSTNYSVTSEGRVQTQETGADVTPGWFQMADCGSTSQYIKTNFYNDDGSFDNVDLFFFDQSAAMNYAAGLTEAIPQSICQ